MAHVPTKSIQGLVWAHTAINPQNGIDVGQDVMSTHGHFIIFWKHCKVGYIKFNNVFLRCTVIVSVKCSGVRLLCP